MIIHREVIRDIGKFLATTITVGFIMFNEPTNPNISMAFIALGMMFLKFK